MPLIFSKVFDTMSCGSLIAKIGSMSCMGEMGSSDKLFGRLTALSQPCFEWVVGLDEVSPSTNYSTISQKWWLYQIKG